MVLGIPSAHSENTREARFIGEYSKTWITKEWDREKHILHFTLEGPDVASNIAFALGAANLEHKFWIFIRQSNSTDLLQNLVYIILVSLGILFEIFDVLRMAAALYGLRCYQSKAIHDCLITQTWKSVKFFCRNVVLNDIKSLHWLFLQYLLYKYYLREVPSKDVCDFTFYLIWNINWIFGNSLSLDAASPAVPSFFFVVLMTH